MTDAHDRVRLPALRSIQVFEAAARLESFTAAANELGVTQSAVSRQVQQLEAELDTSLFARSGPRLALTESGHHLAVKARQALAILAEATRAVAKRKNRHCIIISMLPSVAAKWFAPRLSTLTSQLPGFDIQLLTSRSLTNLDREPVDLALRYGKGPWPNTRAIWLGDETVFPVCSVDYADRMNLRVPVDLARATLLHSDIEQDWPAWFQAAGLEAATVPQGPILTDDAATLQAAVDGQGVALGRSRLVQADLAASRLIAPFKLSLPASYSYWLVRSAKQEEDAVHALLTAWFTRAFLETSDAP